MNNVERLQGILDAYQDAHNALQAAHNMAENYSAGEYPDEYEAQMRGHMYACYTMQLGIEGLMNLVRQDIKIESEVQS